MKKKNALREFDMQPLICLNYRKKTTNADIIVQQFFFYQTRHYVLQLDSSIKLSLFKKYLIATNNLRLLYTETRTNQVPKIYSKI